MEQVLYEHISGNAKQRKEVMESTLNKSADEIHMGVAVDGLEGRAAIWRDLWDEWADKVRGWKPCKERWKEIELSSLKRQLWGDLTAAFQYLRGVYEKTEVFSSNACQEN